MIRAIAILTTLGLSVTLSAADWPQFRGPLGTSASDGKLSIDWSRPDVVAWRATLPGRGPSSPIVVNGRVIVTASSGNTQDRLHVLCFDAKDGKKLWERQFWATGRTITHPSSANAAPTPASDGRRVFAFFSSNDLAALDLDGNLLWYRGLAYDYPKTGNDVGMSSSPIVVDGTVIVQVENQANSFAAGIDAESGATKWKIQRAPEASWCSPVLFHDPQSRRQAVLLQSSDRLSAHDAATGRELWMHKASCDVISSAAADSGIVFVPSEGLTALDTKASETSPSVVWKGNTLGPGAASPVVQGENLFIINRGGVLNCASTKTGEVLWRLRLEGAFWGTPTLVGDQLICCPDNGLVQIVGLAAEGKPGVINAKVDLKDKIQSSPAVADNAVFLRSDSNLIKLQ